MSSKGKLVHLDHCAVMGAAPYTVAVWWPFYFDYGKRSHYDTAEAAKQRCAQLAAEGYHTGHSQIHCWITKDGKTEKYQYVPM